MSNGVKGLIVLVLAGGVGYYFGKKSAATKR